MENETVKRITRIKAIKHNIDPAIVIDILMAGFQEANKKMVPVLKAVDTLWFDAKDAGACMFCDANLHENAMGKHQMLEGDPCPIQLVHDFLKASEGHLPPRGTNE